MQPTPRDVNLLTTREAARYLRVHPETMRQWARTGRIAAVKFGDRGGFRFNSDDIERFLATRQVSPSRSP